MALQNTHAHGNNHAHLLLPINIQTPNQMPRQQRKQDIARPGKHIRKHRVPIVRLRAPAPPGRHRQPIFLHWIALDPDEQRLQDHDDIHDQHDGPHVHFQLAVGQPQDGDAERRLGPQAREDRQEAAEAAAVEEDGRDVLRQDVAWVVAEAHVDDALELHARAEEEDLKGVSKGSDEAL